MRLAQPALDQTGDLLALARHVQRGFDGRHQQHHLRVRQVAALVEILHDLVHGVDRLGQLGAKLADQCVVR